MSARCFEDSCSVEWSEVTTGSGPAFQADVKTDSLTATPTIKCDDPHEGLFVVVSPTSGNALIETANGLFASIPNHVISSFASASLTSMPQGTDSTPPNPVSSADFSYTNTTGRAATVIVVAELNVSYGILGLGHTFPYTSGEGKRSGSITPGAAPAGGVNAPVIGFNAQFGSRLLGDVGVAPTPVTPVAGVRMPVGGTMNVFDGGTDIQFQVARSSVQWAVNVPNGQSVKVKGTFFYQGPSQTINVVTAQSVAGAGSNVGVSINRGQFIVIPHG